MNKVDVQATVHGGRVIDIEFTFDVVNDDGTSSSLPIVESMKLACELLDQEFPNVLLNTGRYEIKLLCSIKKEA